MNLPDPAKFNSTESERFLQDFAKSLKAYLNDPNFLVHLGNAQEYPDVIQALAYFDVVLVLDLL